MGILAVVALSIAVSLLPFSLSQSFERKGTSTKNSFTTDAENPRQQRRFADAGLKWALFGFVDAGLFDTEFVENAPAISYGLSYS